MYSTISFRTIALIVFNYVFFNNIDWKVFWFFYTFSDVSNTTLFSGINRIHANEKRFFLIIFLLYILFYFSKSVAIFSNSTTYNDDFRIFGISSFSDLVTSYKIQILYLFSLILAQTNSFHYKWSGNVLFKESRHIFGCLPDGIIISNYDANFQT